MSCLVLLLFIILDNFNFTYWIPTTCLWIFFHKVVGPFFSPRCHSTLGPLWSYDSWIFNYLCNHYLLPLNLWVRTSSRQGVLDKHYGIKFDSNLWHVGGVFRVLRFPPPIYNWNIVESCWNRNHHKPNQPSHSTHVCTSCIRFPLKFPSAYHLKFIHKTIKESLISDLTTFWSYAHWFTKKQASKLKFEFTGIN